VVNVRENSTPGSRFRLPSGPAYDPDNGLNGTIKGYKLESQDKAKFKLVSEGAELFIEQIGELDREEKGNYSMQLIALDGGDPPRCVIFVLKMTVTLPHYHTSHYSDMVIRES